MVEKRKEATPVPPRWSPRLKAQARTIPIVFTQVSDPVGSGFIDGFAKPGGNITGFTNLEVRWPLFLALSYSSLRIRSDRPDRRLNRLREERCHPPWQPRTNLWRERTNLSPRPKRRRTGENLPAARRNFVAAVQKIIQGSPRVERYIDPRLAGRA
jgi:hypothetical protein